MYQRPWALLAILCALWLPQRSWAIELAANPDLRLLPPVDDPDDSFEALPPPLPGLDAVAPHDEIVVPEEKLFTWHDWFTTTCWSIPDEWDNSFEVGVDGSEGNSTTLTLRTGAHLRRKNDWSDLKVNLTYVKSSADYVQTKHNGQLEAHHDWLLGESRWIPFAKTLFVYDEFRPYSCELTLNAGMGYRFIKAENTSFIGRFGSGASRKFHGTDNVWDPEAMFGLEFEHKISTRQKLRAKTEYYPEWNDFGLYRIRTDAGWEVLLDERTNMSLKLGIIDRYDTRDSGRKPNALDYTLLLLWKL
jgi:putative salt-induced outer membrane protein YdiY